MAEVKSSSSLGPNNNDPSRNPFDILRRSVNYDESVGRYSALVAPLESASVHGSKNQERFQAIVQYLMKPSDREARDRFGKISISAVTPIVLSGLIAQEHQVSLISQNDSEDKSSALLLECQRLRKSAIRKLQIQEKQMLVIRYALFVAFLGGVVLWLYRHWLIWNLKLQQHLSSCRIREARSCRLAQVALYWQTAKSPVGEPIRPSTQLHTHLLPMLSSNMTLRRNYWSMKGDIDLMNGIEDVQFRLVRDALVTYGNMPLMDQRLLDVGCGTGSLFEHVTELSFYHGLSLTVPEVEVARALHPRASFEQGDFLAKDWFHDKASYSSIVAVDSLVHYTGNDLRQVLASLMVALKPGGLFIFIDDVVHPDGEDDPSLQGVWGYKDWQTTLQGLGCRMVHARDLSLEYWIDFQTQIGIYNRNLLPYFGVNELRKDQKQLLHHWQQRKMHYQEALLMYHLYVCRRD